MKRILLFVVMFFAVDRFLSYKVEQVRRYGQIELSKKRKLAIQAHLLRVQVGSAHRAS